MIKTPISTCKIPQGYHRFFVKDHIAAEPPVARKSMLRKHECYCDQLVLIAHDSRSANISDLLDPRYFNKQQDTTCDKIEGMIAPMRPDDCKTKAVNAALMNFRDPKYLRTLVEGQIAPLSGMHRKAIKRCLENNKNIKSIKLQPKSALNLNKIIISNPNIREIDCAIPSKDKLIRTIVRGVASISKQVRTEGNMPYGNQTLSSPEYDRAQALLSKFHRHGYTSHLKKNVLPHLGKNYLPMGLERLYIPLKKNTLKHLTLSAEISAIKSIGLDNIDALFKLLKGNRSLELLSLTKFSISLEGLKSLEDVLKIHPNLRTLVLKQCFKDADKGYEAIAEALSSDTCLLETLKISNCGIEISQETLEKFTAAIRQNKSLKVLEFDISILSQGQLRLLTEALKDNKNIQRFIFTCPIDYTFNTSEILPLFEGNTTLKELVVNDANDVFIQALAQGLQETKSSNITTLKLRLDMISSSMLQQGLNDLKKMLKVNSKITALSIDASDVMKRTKAQFLAILEKSVGEINELLQYNKGLAAQCSELKV